MSVNSSVDAISADLSENVLVQNATLHRKIGWQGAFWVASGVPALVLFSIGAIAATVGKPAWMIWAISLLRLALYKHLLMLKLQVYFLINLVEHQFMVQWRG